MLDVTFNCPKLCSTKDVSNQVSCYKMLMFFNNKLCFANDTPVNYFEDKNNIMKY